MRNQIVFRLCFLLLVFLPFIESFSQGFVSNMKIEQKDSLLIISYNLSGKYINISKIKSFDVSLLYSKDNGSTFEVIHDADGMVGPNILPEENLKINWKINQPFYALVGNYSFKLLAKPNTNSLSIGLVYTRGFLFGGDEEYVKINGFNQGRIFFYFNSKRGKGGFLIYTGFSYLNFIAMWETFNYGEFQKEQTFKLVNIGFGYQINKRSLAWFVGGGFGTRESYSTEHGEEYGFSGSLSGGLIVKLIDTKGFTLGIPIEFGVGGLGSVIFSTGLSLQF